MDSIFLQAQRRGSISLSLLDYFRYFFNNICLCVWYSLWLELNSKSLLWRRKSDEKKKNIGWRIQEVIRISRFCKLYSQNCLAFYNFNRFCYCHFQLSPCVYNDCFNIGDHSEGSMELALHLKRTCSSLWKFWMYGKRHLHWK